MASLPKGSLILVTGSNGFIASHIVDQLLQVGFNVRGTVREASKADWLTDYVAEKYGTGRFEAAIVPDMSVKGAFDDAVKGVPCSFPAIVAGRDADPTTIQESPRSYT